MTLKYIEYAKHLEGEDKVSVWINSNLKNYLTKYSGKDNTKNLENQSEIEHIIDYLVSDKCPKKIDRMSYADAKSNADRWSKTLIKKGSKIIELEEDTKIIKDFKDGFKIVKLIGEKAFEREGFLMRHCVSSYFGKNIEVYSLRDKDNMPHCTMEKDQQIKGKGNGSISPKYIKYIVSFLEEVGMSVGDNEMKNLGYFNASEFKKYLHSDTNFFNDDYLFLNDELFDKKGNRFYSFALLNHKSLYDKKRFSFNWDLQSFLKGAISFEMGKANESYSTAVCNESYSTAVCNESSSTAVCNKSYSTAVCNESSSTAVCNESYSTAVCNEWYSTAVCNESSSTAVCNKWYSTAVCNDKNSLAITRGEKSKTMGKIGGWLIMADHNNDGEIIDIISIKVDGKNIKEDTLYELKNGKFSEVE